MSLRGIKELKSTAIPYKMQASFVFLSLFFVHHFSFLLLEQGLLPTEKIYGQFLGPFALFKFEINQIKKEKYTIAISVISKEIALCKDLPVEFQRTWQASHQV